MFTILSIAVFIGIWLLHSMKCLKVCFILETIKLAFKQYYTKKKNFFWNQWTKVMTKIEQFSYFVEEIRNFYYLTYNWWINLETHFFIPVGSHTFYLTQSFASTRWFKYWPTYFKFGFTRIMWRNATKHTKKLLYDKNWRSEYQ